jgi:hypothetical protein
LLGNAPQNDEAPPAGSGLRFEDVHNVASSVLPIPHLVDDAPLAILNKKLGGTIVGRSDMSGP